MIQWFCTGLARRQRRSRYSSSKIVTTTVLRIEKKDKDRDSFSFPSVSSGLCYIFCHCFCFSHGFETIVHEYTSHCTCWWLDTNYFNHIKPSVITLWMFSVIQA